MAVDKLVSLPHADFDDFRVRQGQSPQERYIKPNRSQNGSPQHTEQTCPAKRIHKRTFAGFWSEQNKEFCLDVNDLPEGQTYGEERFHSHMKPEPRGP
jgi:hypothetical protein